MAARPDPADIAARLVRAEQRADAAEKAAARLAIGMQELRTELLARIGDLEAALTMSGVAHTRASDETAPKRARTSTSARIPLALPGGVAEHSPEAAQFLVRQPGARVVVDGYNVAMLGWPSLRLEAQRDRCISACEDVGRRYEASVVVLFDGAAVPGASTTLRRLVQVRFSSPGTSADDLIREYVKSLHPDVPVVVVTNDREVITDVRAMGANTIRSEQLLELSGR